ncbi:MAG: TolC family protein, partial [Candidatus Korobacteraceae bacterium]
CCISILYCCDPDHNVFRVRRVLCTCMLRATMMGPFVSFGLKRCRRVPSFMRKPASARIVWLLVTAIFGVTIPATLRAQTPITLSDAVAMALEKNPAHRQAYAARLVAAAAVRESRATLFPRLAFSQSGTRSNDPVFVFGARLRQQRFTMADFALNRLNRPVPIGDFSSRFSAQWTIFDSFQNLRQVRLARLAEQSAGHALERADQEVVYRVTEAYYALLLAAKKVELAEASLKTAESVQERSSAMVETGMRVESDLLSARTATAVRRQDLVQARNDLAVAEAALALALGLSPEEQLRPAEALEEAHSFAGSLQELEQSALENRPELKQARTELTAQQTGITMAKSAFGPKVNAFGSWQTNSPSLSWNGGNNWTAGVEVQIDLFDGGSRRARLARIRASADQATAAAVGVQDSIRLQVRRAYYDLDTARQQVEISRTAIAEARESLRIHQDRYESGLTTLTELLRAEEAADRAQTDYWDAVYRAHTSSARLELASGTLSSKPRP